MIEGLKPYENYRDTGLPWLQRAPVGWSVLAPKRLVKAQAGGTIIKNRASLEKLSGYVPAFSASGQDIWLPNATHHGDALVLSAVGARCGKTFKANGAWGVVANTHILRPGAGQVRDYWWYVTNNESWWERAGAAQPFIQVSRTLSRLWAVAPPDEQSAIVRFLDHATRRIDAYIRAKRKLIALLNEQKQAIIHQAVTRGLDPDVKMKDSGVPWLGEVPEHWEVVALGRLANARCDGPFGSGLKSQHYVDEGVRVVRLQNIGVAEFRDQSKAFISAAHYATLGDHDVLAGDLLLAGLGDARNPAGRACLAPTGIEPAMVKADCFRFRLKTKPTQTLLIAHQLSATAKGAAACLSAGSTRTRINLSTTSSRKVAVPPADEAKRILDRIAEATKPTEEAIDRTEREITLLREYRTRLIADIVTGQLDVREAAKNLPEIEVEGEGIIEDDDEPEEELLETA